MIFRITTTYAPKREQYVELTDEAEAMDFLAAMRNMPPLEAGNASCWGRVRVDVEKSEK